MPKIPTNEQLIKKLLKELSYKHPMFMAILRERIVKVAEITNESLEKEPQKWENGIVHPDYYREFNKIVKETIGFDK